MKRLALALALAITLGAAPSARSASDDVDIYAKHGFRATRPVVSELAPEDFVIMPWGWTPNDAQSLREIKECGFNLAGFIAPEYARAAEKAGLKYIIDDTRISEFVDKADLSDAEIAKRVSDATRPFRGNPMTFGYYLRDEPHSGRFANLARWHAALAKASPKSLAYINLLPIDGQDKAAGTYEDYIEKFISTVHPTYLSYDKYSVRDDGTFDPSFFANLEVVRRAALKHDMLFWNIILGHAHFRCATPTPGSLGVQVFSTLAYGGRGICYFTYYSPLIGNYRDAAVDQFLNKTPTWDMIRLLNLQIRQLAPTLLKLKSMNVFHYPDAPEGCSGKETSRYVETVSGGSFLVGEFQGPEGRPYVMIVNKDIHLSSGFRLKFREAGKVMMTNPYTGFTVPFGGENGWLAPGHGMLLSLEKQATPAPSEGGKR